MGATRGQPHACRIAASWRLGRLLALALCVAWASSAGGQARPPAERVVFDGYTLVLAWQGGTPGESIKEYIAAGEQLESWTRLASVREYPKLSDPKAVAGNLVRAFKQQNPAAQSSIIENPATGEVIVDFVTWPPNHAFVEFNIFKYAKRPGGGLVAHQYALREYQDTTGFLSALKPLRERHVGLMARDGLRITTE